jgi:AcrR family transcriptional regulator
MTSQIEFATKRSRHDLVLDSAALQLANFGVGTSSIPEIAACTGLTRSALYYYAKSKEDLVFQVYHRSCIIMAETAKAIRSTPNEASQKLVEFVRSIADRQQIDVIALSEVGMLDAGQQSSVLAGYEAVVSEIEGLLREGVNRGELRACDPEIAARTVVSIVQHLCMIRAWTQFRAAISPLGDQVPDFGRLVTGTTDLLLNGWAKDRNRPIPLQLIDFTPLLVTSVRAFDREGQARAKREEILITASRLFNQRGVSSTTLDDIAAELGATKRTLYHHVGDKQTLLSACHERSRNIIKHIYSEYDRRAEGREDQAAAQLNYLRSTALAQLRPDIAPLRISVGIPELDDAGRNAHEEYIQWLLKIGSIHRKRLKNCDALRVHDGKALNLIHVGGVNWLAKGLVSISEDRMTDVACEVVDVLRLGLKPIT